MCLNCHYFCACVLSCPSLNPLVFSTVVHAIFYSLYFFILCDFSRYFLFLCRLFSFLLYFSLHTQLAFPHLQMNANLYICIYYILSCFFLYDVIGTVCLLNLTTYHLFHTHFLTTNNYIFYFFLFF